MLPLLEASYVLLIGMSSCCFYNDKTDSIRSHKRKVENGHVKGYSVCAVNSPLTNMMSS